MTQWFGEPWPAPDYRAHVCEDDRLRVPTPVGVPCKNCEEPIAETDQGEVFPGYIDCDADGKPRWVAQILPVHKECMLREVMGCYGNMTGTAHSHDVPYREDARRVWNWVERHGVGAHGERH